MSIPSGYVQIVYPQTRLVSFAEITTWYNDAVANGVVVRGSDALTDVRAQARALDDAGAITLSNRYQEPTTVEKADRFEDC